MPEDIAVLLDFQNVHLTGHSLYGGGVEPYRCVPDPARLADLIAGRRKRPSATSAVYAYRGPPDPTTSRCPPRPTMPRVQVIRRQLNYRDWPNLRPQEKGIDVQIAVDLIRLAFGGRHQALVLFSSDTDLLPALETVVRLRLGHVEVACWSGFKPLRSSGSNLSWCHFLSEADRLAVTEDWQGRI